MGGTTEVAVSAHNLALVDLGLDGRPRVAARDHATYFVRFVIPDVIELKDNYVGLSTVQARMLHQIVHDVLPVLNSEFGSSAIGADYVELLVGQVVLAGVLAALFWIGVSMTGFYPFTCADLEPDTRVLNPPGSSSRDMPVLFTPAWCATRDLNPDRHRLRACRSAIELAAPGADGGS
jgi:hypothetical protein